MASTFNFIPKLDADDILHIQDWFEIPKSIQTTSISSKPTYTLNTPLSRALLPADLVQQLDKVSLGAIISSRQDVGHTSGKTPQRSTCLWIGPLSGLEYFCWEIHPHITAFSYVHPDGYAPGSTAYEKWRLNIQKQYAFLLLRREYLSRKNKAVTTTTQKSVNVKTVDFLSKAIVIQGDKPEDALAKELANVENTIKRFKWEQAQLQRAAKTVILPAFSIRACNPSKGHDMFKDSGIGSMPPTPIKANSFAVAKIILKPGHKRYASESLRMGIRSRSFPKSLDRKRLGTKQRKLDHCILGMGVDGHSNHDEQIDVKDEHFTPAEESHAVQGNAKLLGTTHAADSTEASGISEIESDVAGSDIDVSQALDSVSKTDDELFGLVSSVEATADDVTVVDESATPSHGGIAENDDSLDQDVPVCTGKYDWIDGLIKHVESCIEVNAVHAEIAMLDALLTDVNSYIFEAQSIGEYAAEISREFNETHKIQGEITVEEVQDLVPKTGISYDALVDMIEGFFEDTAAGFKECSQVIEEAGRVGKLNGKLWVWRKGTGLGQV